MPQQDFLKKMVVILKDDLTSWLLINMTGHINAFYGVYVTTADVWAGIDTPPKQS